MKYKIGDTVYIRSRYDGVVKRTIVSIVSEEDNTYELESIVQITKTQYIGDSHVNTWEGDFGSGTCICYPAPEEYLMQLGDKVFNGFFGIHEDKILTEEMVTED